MEPNMSKANIFIDTDLTSASDPTIEVGLKWSKVLGCQANIMHIKDENEFDRLGVLFPDFAKRSSDFGKMVENSIEKKLRLQIERVAGKSHDAASLVLYGNNRVERFVQVAKERRGKILVVSLENKEEDSFLFGKMVGRLIRLSPLPVLIVKDSRALAPKTISFPFAFQGLSQDASQWVEILAGLFKSTVFPLHIVDKQIKQEAITESLDLEKLEDLYHSVYPFWSMKNRFHELNAEVNCEKLKVVHPKKENSKDVLLNSLQELNSDLIVMGTNAKSSFERLYLGSFCEFILRNTPSSLLITKKF
jgi:nucleotide-binding universal stress UspA family protein